MAGVLFAMSVLFALAASQVWVRLDLELDDDTRPDRRLLWSLGAISIAALLGGVVALIVDWAS